jgi:hypothetical protein
MASPFPGMDPYLEAHWRDVHHNLITYARDALQEVLPSELRARVEERVVLETPEGIGANPLYPDLRLIEGRPQDPRFGPAAVEGIAVAEPFLVELEHEPLTEGFIEIIDAESGNRVVTVIEFLSPTNKTSAAGRLQYLRKQSEICGSDTSLVEIDLVRRGAHVLAVPLDHLPPRRQTPYMVCVRRPWVRGKAEVYSIHLSQRLPTIKVPLRQTDADVPLDLQTLIDRCYRMGRYEGDLDYRRDPDPPLTGADAKWADQLLRSKGLRAVKSANGKRRRKPPRSGGK